MGKQGPCYHCGVTSTPLWRNGPPEKPVLCNACGSRWRTKGTLAHYTPLHARAEPDDFEDYKNSRNRNISIKDKEIKILKRKQNYDSLEAGAFASDGNQNLLKGFDEDAGNRSSSGSAISNSESCAPFSGADASDLTGPSQSAVWDSMVPSRKRTCVARTKPSPIEKLTKDLYTILHEQQCSILSGSSEEDLLYESDKPMVSVEIGHGSVLIRHPSSIARDEDSEASSLSVDNKLRPVDKAHSQLTASTVNNDNTVVNMPSSGSSGVEQIKKPPSLCTTGLEQAKRDQLEKLQMLGHHNSPLRYVDLRDVVNFESFMSCLTSDEQLQMRKFLPPVDIPAPPESLRNMFESVQSEETLSSFQKLLGEGVFDNTLSGVTTDDCRTLKRFILCNLVKYKWAEQYASLKDGKCKGSTSTSEVALERNVIATGHSVNVRRSRDSNCMKFEGAKTKIASPERSTAKAKHENREFMESDGSSFGPRSLFALPPDNNSLVFDPSHSVEGSSDQDLLLDVPTNNSFPQAELLYPTSSFSAQASASSSSVYPRLLRP